MGNIFSHSIGLSLLSALRNPQQQSPLDWGSSLLILVGSTLHTQSTAQNIWSPKPSLSVFMQTIAINAMVYQIEKCIFCHSFQICVRGVSLPLWVDISDAVREYSGIAAKMPWGCEADLSLTWVCHAWRVSHWVELEVRDKWDQWSSLKTSPSMLLTLNVWF